MALRVDDFRPADGWPGTILVVDGAGFSPWRDGNEVFIGGERALILEASGTQLRVLAGEKTRGGALEVVVGPDRAAAPAPFRVLPVPDIRDTRVAGPPAFFHGPQKGTPAVGVANQPVLFAFAFPTDHVPGAVGDMARMTYINTALDGAMRYWREATYGRTTWAPTVTGWLPLPNDHNFYIWEQTDIDEARRAYLQQTRRCAAFGLGHLFAGTQGEALHIASRSGLPIIHTAGHPITSVFADTANLYVASGATGIAIYEPPRPDDSITQVWASGPGVWFHDVDARGGWMAATALEQGTWLWQLAPGPSPALITKIPPVIPTEWATSVRIIGSRLFVAEGQTLRVYDFSNPLAPTLALSVDAGAWIMDFDIAGNIFAAATDGNGIAVADLSFAVPVVMSLLTERRLHSVDISGTRAFAAAGDAGLLIFDITNPLAPALISRLDTEGAAYHVVVGARFVDVSTGADEMRQIDASDPAAPFIDQRIRLRNRLVDPPDLKGLLNALNTATAQIGQTQRRGALMHDAFTAARDAGFNPDDFEGLVVILNGPYVRANSGLATQFRNEDSGDTLRLNGTKGTFYDWIGSGEATLAHEVGHWLGLPDLYQDVLKDGVIIRGTAGPWSLMGDSFGLPLFCARELHDQLSVYTTGAPNVNVVQLDWSPASPPLDSTFEIAAHDANEDADPNRIHVLKLVVASGLTYYVEVRHRTAGRIFDQNITVPSPPNGIVVVTRATQARSISNTFERPVSLFGALNIGEQVVDAARRLTIAVEAVVQNAPLVFRVRVRWNQPIAGDPNGQFDLTITPWNTDEWETVDIWIDSPRNNSGGAMRFENHEPGDDTKPVLNGDRPWVQRPNTIFARIRNTGPITVPEAWVSFYSTSPPGVGDNGNWSLIETQHVLNVPGNGEMVLQCAWTPDANAHTCLRVGVLPQIGEIEPNNNEAQENVFTFDSPGGSSHDPVTLAARVRSPFTVDRKVDAVVRGLPMGWHVVVDHAWVWTGPLGEHDLSAVIWTDLDAPYSSGPPLNQDERLRIPKRAGARIEGWTDLGDRYLPIGGLYADVKANKRVTGTFTANVDGRTVYGNGSLTPPMPNIPICIELMDINAIRWYLYATTDASGAFTFNSAGLTLLPGRYIVQAFVSGNDDAAEFDFTPRDVIVP